VAVKVDEAVAVGVCVGLGVTVAVFVGVSVGVTLGVNVGSRQAGIESERPSGSRVFPCSS
jgi:hypothetical protein